MHGMADRHWEAGAWVSPAGWFKDGAARDSVLVPPYRQVPKNGAPASFLAIVNLRA